MRQQRGIVSAARRANQHGQRHGQQRVPSKPCEFKLTVLFYILSLIKRGAFMGNEDRYMEEWDAKRGRGPLRPRELRGGLWSLALALFGFFAPFGFYQYLSYGPFRYDMAWWEGMGAIVFLLFAAVIGVLEAIACAIALRARRTWAAKFALGFVALSVAFTLWIVFLIVMGIAGYAPG
jgi:hypothetical protein